jgi:HK97 family phage prohead protease|tara:strand:- start:24715 stop:26217 length:1503 start_codon:yes stop_codon:yes gene_type:complete
MSEEKEIKNINFEMKEESDKTGEVKAVFSVFNDVDSDGDVVVPGAVKSGFKGGSVPMVWSHKWDMPIGKGMISQDNDMATFTGEFFMDTESGKEAYNLVKSMGDLQQWSFGFRVNDAEYGKFQKDGKDEEDVRYLKDLSVYEVSPVLVGANQETFTMAIKSDKETEAKIVQSVSVSDDPDLGGVKDTLTSDSIKPEEPKEEVKDEEEKAAPKGDTFATPAEAEQRAKEIGCVGSHMHDADGQAVFMPCATHEDYESRMQKSTSAMTVLANIAAGMKEILNSVPTDDASLDALKEINLRILSIVDGDSEVSEKSASVQGKRFSDEVKDVLAALNNLVARVQSIGELRKKNKRKLGVSTTEALRTVQESVQDAFDELDKFVEEFGTEGALEMESNEVETAEDTVEVTENPDPELATEEVAEETVEAQAETEDPAEEPEVDTGDERQVDEVVNEAEEVSEVEIEEVEVDSELDDLWLESQRIATETLLTDIEIEDNEIIEEIV